MSLNAKEEMWVRKQVMREEQHVDTMPQLIEKLGQKYSPLLKYMDSIDGTFGCRDRYEKSISLDPTALAGHYSMLCDQAISLILPEILNSLRVHKP